MDVYRFPSLNVYGKSTGRAPTTAFMGFIVGKRLSIDYHQQYLAKIRRGIADWGMRNPFKVCRVSGGCEGQAALHVTTSSH